MNNLSKDDILRLIDIAVERNILCYDIDAPCEVPTTKLISTLKCVARLRGDDKSRCLLDSILVDSSFMEMFITNPNTLESRFVSPVYQKDGEDHVLYGLKVIESLLLEPDDVDSVIKYFTKELGGSLQFQDSHIVIMFNSKKPISELSVQDVLLGSY